MLDSIPGLRRLEPADQDLCCGSAGIYNIVQPEAAAELGERKARAVLETGAEAYASANPGCLVQVSAALRRLGRPLPAFHPIELLDASIRGVEPDRLLEEARTMSTDDVLTAEAVEFLHLLAREFEDERRELLAARAARARRAARRRAAGVPARRRAGCARATGGCRRRRRIWPTAASRSPGRPIARW